MVLAHILDIQYPHKIPEEDILHLIKFLDDGF